LPKCCALKFSVFEGGGGPRQHGYPVRADSSDLANGFPDGILKPHVVILGHQLLLLTTFLELDGTDDDVLEGGVRIDFAHPPIFRDRFRREPPGDMLRRQERNFSLPVQVRQQVPAHPMIPRSIRAAPFPFSTKLQR